MSDSTAITVTTLTATASTPEPSPTSEPVSLREKLQRFVAVKTLADVLNDAVKDARSTITKELVREYADNDVAKTVVRVNGAKVATATVNEPSAETKVTDEEALLEWARQNRPDLVEVIEHPATEAWTETRVKAPELTRLVQDSEDTGSGDLTTQDGEIIPGLRYVAHPTPTSFGVHYTRPTHKSADPLAGGRREVLEAFARGDLSLHEALDNLGEITPG